MASPILSSYLIYQGRNRRENLDATSAMVGKICPPPSPGGDRVKVSENLGATSVTPVTPVDTSLTKILKF